MLFSFMGFPVQCYLEEPEFCKWYENTPSKTTFVNEILTPGMQNGVEIDLYIASDCNARVILSEDPSVISGLVLGW